ncbi:hypothetical protein [Streptomyces sp. NRRL S-920]|uniref:hypothetical protein n=1 Tax=Streptomyces sp. NRRL S-920 TaxID=1463921 RepID=UPI0004C9394D|nr:hypothetical protein [Streptomyces sp. NRRL S-920]
MYAISYHASLYRRLPPQARHFLVRHFLVRRVLGPLGAWWLRGRYCIGNALRARLAVSRGTPRLGAGCASSIPGPSFTGMLAVRRRGR